MYLNCVLSDEEDVALLGPLLVPEEQMRVEVDRGAAGVLGHAVPVVDVVGDVARRLLVKELRVGRVGADRCGQ